jgi:riboflavin kinase/FMN adenylyltransferase
MTGETTLIDALSGQPIPRGGVWALGNFDGVHLGHRAVATRAGQIALGLGVPAHALTFDPHPYIFFQKEKAPFQLMSLRAKRLALLQCGLHDVVTLSFTKDFAAQSARAFVDEVLVKGCGVQHVVVGFDYCFGACRTGDRDLLRQLLEPQGIGVTEVPPMRDETGEILSSTRIRKALQAGDVGAAMRQLGGPFVIEGIVEKGDQRGRQLGFPTANIGLGDYIRPLHGVYAVRARRQGSHETYQGVANIGIRPTVGGAKELLEAHLFDFDQDIYGQSWEVELHSFIRREEKFASLAALQAQMQHDTLAAKDFFTA